MEEPNSCGSFFRDPFFSDYPEGLFSIGGTFGFHPPREAESVTQMFKTAIILGMLALAGASVAAGHLAMDAQKAAGAVEDGKIVEGCATSVMGPCCKEGETIPDCAFRVTDEIIEGTAEFAYRICTGVASPDWCDSWVCGTLGGCTELEECQGQGLTVAGHEVPSLGVLETAYDVADAASETGQQVQQDLPVEPGSSPAL